MSHDPNSADHPDATPDSILLVATTLAYLRASWENRTPEDVNSTLESAISRLYDLAEQLDGRVAELRSLMPSSGP